MTNERNTMTGWFGPKVIGYGASPRIWQGWMVSAVMIAAIAACVHYHVRIAGLPAPWDRYAAPDLLLLAYVVIVRATYRGAR